MKVILIDPIKREIKGIEIDPLDVADALTSAFGNKKIFLVSKMIGRSLVLCHDGHAMPPAFLFEGYPIPGKAILFGRENGNWPAPIALNVKDIECLVRFAS